MQDPPIRKRPAPGTSPLVQQPIMSQQQAQPQQQQQQQQPHQYQYAPIPDNPDFSNYNFSAPLPVEQPYSDPSAFDANNFAFNLNTTQPPTYPANLAPAPSTELVRRSRNQQLAAPNGQQEQWNGFGDFNAQADDEDEQDLELKVALAKKDAQGKRKQIPPFVQKLSSFLDSNNTDLIRWSDDGRSFIVLDEDEFARTLIPELFKHNNYASFVRQLNMYGFHKTVNITDGSLRQSEKARKGVKPPSMYSHPYFRKNRPDLLWLIQKPVGSKATKRKRDGNMKDPYDSDDDRQYSPVPELGGPPQQLSAPNNNTNTATSQDLAQLPRNELASVRRELQNLQTQQKFISQMITQLKEQNDQFYRQATAFQALHDRHENSINAILTFLATFYNRSLEGHSAQNLVNMFTNAMPPAGAPQQQHQQHGSVVEEYNDGTPTPTNQVQRFVKRPPLLLPGPTAATAQNPNLQPGSAVTEPSSTRASVSPPNDNGAAAPLDGARTASSTPAMKTDASTPTNLLHQVPESNDQMMNLINNVNASTSSASTPGPTTAGSASASAGATASAGEAAAAAAGGTAQGAVDMNSIVDRLAQSTQSPLTPQQRDDMVASLSSNPNNGANNGANNALASYTNSASPAEFRARIGESQSTLDYLQHLQKQQDARVQELNRRLQPLSPTGTIPGLHDFAGEAGGGERGDPFDSFIAGGGGDYDAGDFIDFGDGVGDGDGEYDFGFGADGGAGVGGAEGGWDWDGDADLFGPPPADPSTTDANAGADIGAGVLGTGYGGGGAPGEGEGEGGRVESISSEATSPATLAVGEEPGTPNKRVRRE